MAVKNDSPLEDEECKLFHRWLVANDIPHEHIPNESRSSKQDAFIRGSKLKSMGVSKGYWDYVIYVPYYGIDGSVDAYEEVMVEMKRKKGSRVSSEQIAWQEVYEKAGRSCKICKGWEEARDFVTSLMQKQNGDSPF